MKIAQVAPLNESIPPKTYGGTERIVHYLTEKLVEQGHDVTLYATADSNSSAHTRAIIPESLRTQKNFRHPVAAHTLQMMTLLDELTQYDLVHFHTDFYQFMLAPFLSVPHISTMHCRLDTTDYHALFNQYPQMPSVCISKSHGAQAPQANWVSTVYNGIPKENYTFQAQSKGEYLAFVGRLSPLKNPKAAIEIAIAADRPLKIAAKIDVVDEPYFESEVKPYLSHPLIEFIGEVNEAEKDALMGGADALLFPIAWPEPFGLVMTESMACGTPVIAFNRGAVPEVMVDGKTGFIVDTVEQAISALDALPTISRAACRAHFETHFSSEKMCDAYNRVYIKQIQQQSQTKLVKPMRRSNAKSKATSNAINEKTAAQDKTPQTAS